MTTRQDLEYAAKAAKIEGCIEYAGGIVLGIRQKDRTFWNPEHDDGDSFRLMVKMEFYVKRFDAIDDEDYHYPAFLEVWRTEDDDPIWTEFDVDNVDPTAATRLAILRAAIEIGKGMK